MKIERLNEVNSTNEYIKKYIPQEENVIVCAKRQTGGMGTKGRSFCSEEGGIYCTALWFYHNVKASEAFRVMAHAAVSVCKTARLFGVEPQIKWPNDVLVNGKKLCGILIENKIAEGKLLYSVVGIGLNVCNRLEGLEEIAISLSEASGKDLQIDEVFDKLCAFLGQPSSMSEYASFVRFLQKEVVVLEGERRYKAVAKEILPDGRLVVEAEGRLKTLSAAEISLRL